MQQKFISDSNLISKNKDGKIDTVLVGEKIILETSVGEFIPRHTLDEEGRKKEAPVKFYKTGELKSLPLEEITEVATSVGKIKSELLIFYKSGTLYRTFPLNGQVTGYWTEDNEYQFAETVAVSTALGTINVKPIYLQFYETGELESILFWPKERVLINTPVGEVVIRKGICFYKNGNVKGFEPAKEVVVESPIGSVKVFDPDPNGIHAEDHSLTFYENGAIRSVVTASNQVSAKNVGAEPEIISPKIVTSYCNEDAFFISPLKILFEETTINFMSGDAPVKSFPKSINYKITDFIPSKPISGIACD